MPCWSPAAIPAIAITLPGNYHARRRWILFRELLDTLGFDLRRIHFTWISAAEGKKWQQVITEITEETRQAGTVHRAVPAKICERSDLPGGCARCA